MPRSCSTALEGDAEPAPSRARPSTRRDDLAVVRIKLERPRLISVATDGPAWTVTLGDEVIEPTRPLAHQPQHRRRRAHEHHHPVRRSAPAASPRRSRGRRHAAGRDRARARARLPQDPGLRRVPRARLDPRRRRAAARRRSQRRACRRQDRHHAAGGLDAVGRRRRRQRTAAAPSISRTCSTRRPGASTARPISAERKSQLIRAAAEAPEAKRPVARADLARFYLARDMGAEAKAVLDVALADSPPTAEDPTPLVLRAVANIMLGRGRRGAQGSRQSVRRQPARRAAVARARLCPAGQMERGARGLPHRRAAMGTLPLELQRMVLKDIAARLDRGRRHRRRRATR